MGEQRENGWLSDSSNRTNKSVSQPHPYVPASTDHRLIPSHTRRPRSIQSPVSSLFLLKLLITALLNNSMSCVEHVYESGLFRWFGFGITYKFYFRGKNSQAFDDESKPSLSESAVWFCICYSLLSWVFIFNLFPRKSTQCTNPLVLTLQKIVRVSDFRKLHGNGKMAGQHNCRVSGLLHMEKNWRNDF